MGIYQIYALAPITRFDGVGVYETMNTAVGRLTLGVNYSAGQAVVKVEFEHDSSPVAQGAGYLANVTAGSTATSGNAFFAGVDFIF